MAPAFSKFHLDREMAQFCPSPQRHNKEDVTIDNKSPLLTPCSRNKKANKPSLFKASMLNNMLIVRKKESICKTPKQARKQLKQCQQNRRKQEEKRELEALPLYQEESLSPTNSFDSLFNSQDFGLFESMDMESVDEDVYLRPISETPSCHSEQTVSNVFTSFSVRPEGSTGLIGETNIIFLLIFPALALTQHHSHRVASK
mmetsp:Transcript_37378/g.96600  ORF Transcript_37378/g.96600 Transcript_37378/m.96600 type:complete len:201 (-) Transcript_37378:325-927(-)